MSVSSDLKNSRFSERNMKQTTSVNILKFPWLFSSTEGSGDLVLQWRTSLALVFAAFCLVAAECPAVEVHVFTKT